MSMSPVPPFAYSHPPSETSASPGFPDSKAAQSAQSAQTAQTATSGESAEGPCSSLAAPFWSPIGSFQNVPMTSWSYNAVYAYEQPQGDTPPAPAYISADQGQSVLHATTVNGWHGPSATAPASASTPAAIAPTHQDTNHDPNTGTHSGQGPVDHPPPADPWIVSHRPAQFHRNPGEGMTMPPPPPNTALLAPAATSTGMASGMAMGVGTGYGGTGGSAGGLGGVGSTGSVGSAGGLSLPYTTLSPLFAGFSTASPTSAQPPLSAGALNGRPGPMRGWSYSALPTRRRSNTLLTQDTAGSSSPATPQSAYPYPSPSLIRRPSSSSSSSPFNSSHPSSTGRSHESDHYHGHMPLSTPMSGVRRVFHPSLGSASPGEWYQSNEYPPRISHPGPPRGMGYEGYASRPHLGEVKPPRFRPTKEQLEILIAAYEENKNPDGPTREMLAKRLGPDVRPKTLQIWFQNRRSKSRAKEREAAIPKPLSVKGRTSPLSKDRMTVDMDALRVLAHDDDPTITVIPLTVLSLGSWTRFLTPGAGYQTPDLGCTLSVSHDPHLHFYVVHQTETFRISIPVAQGTISSISATSNEQSHAGQVAISFELARGVAEYAGWGQMGYGPELAGKWRRVGDFTGGQQASLGGRCELTGPRDILLAAFAKVQGIVAGLSSPPPSESLVTPTGPAGPTGPPKPPGPPGPDTIDTSQQTQTWYPPTLSASSEDAPAAPYVAIHGHSRQRSFSLPDPIKTDAVSVHSLDPLDPLDQLNHLEQPLPPPLIPPTQQSSRLDIGDQWQGQLGSPLDLPTPSIERNWSAYQPTPVTMSPCAPSANHQSFTALHQATYIPQGVSIDPARGDTDQCTQPTHPTPIPTPVDTAQSSPFSMRDSP